MNTIILKHSKQGGKVPGKEDLVLGELAVNAVDGSLFLKRSDGTIVEFLPVENPALCRLNFYMHTVCCVVWFIATAAIVTLGLVKAL